MRLLRCSFCLVFLLLQSACGADLLHHELFSSERMVVVDQDPNALASLQTGRDYVAAGRYELAKEQYLMALASSSNPEFTKVVAHELEAVDLMIKTQR